MTAPLAYIPTIRRYYQTLGYGKPYEWASNDGAPFVALNKPMASSRVALITTAAPVSPDAGDQGPGAAYNGAAKFFSVYEADVDPLPDLRISHIAYDRENYDAHDAASWLPIAALQRAVERGALGGLNDQLFGLPTNRSQRTTIDVDAPEIVNRVIASGSDVALLVPNCPVCHQSVSLAARALEAAGVPTVVLGCAKDIVERVAVPRLLFSDLPLGNAAGLPGDVASQDLVIEKALALFAQASGPQTTVESGLRWGDGSAWKQRVMNVDAMSEEEIARRKAAFDQGKVAAKATQGG